MENVPSVKKVESLPFVLFDKLDDEMIIAELEGRMPDILTYHFNQRGKEVFGLSKGGVDEATGELAKRGEVVREIDMVFVDGKDEAFFTCKAARFVIGKEGNEVMLDTKFGTKRQPKDSPFWFEQGSMKAARNAAMRIIPKAIVQGIIEFSKKQGKVKEVKSEEPKVSPKKETPSPYEVTDPAQAFEYYKGKLNKCENIFALRNTWKKHYEEMNSLEQPMFAELEGLKNKLKSQFELREGEI
jgi:hypothetical protein